MQDYKDLSRVPNVLADEMASPYSVSGLYSGFPTLDPSDSCHSALPKYQRAFRPALFFLQRSEVQRKAVSHAKSHSIDQVIHRRLSLSGSEPVL